MRLNGKYRCVCGFNCIWNRRLAFHLRFCRTVKALAAGGAIEAERYLQEQNQ